MRLRLDHVYVIGMVRSLVGVSLLSLGILVACGSDDDGGGGGGKGGSGASGGSGATGGVGASGGSGGGGTGGASNDAGPDSSTGGLAGNATGGAAGAAGGSAGVGGTAGAATGGASGNGGAAGAAGGGGAAGSGGSAGSTGGAGGTGGTGNAPMNTALPTVTGTPKVFETLSSTNGTWVPATGLAFTTAWRRCDGAGNGCVTIAGATGNTRLLETEDFGHTLRVRVTADDGTTQVSADSPPTAIVTAPNCPAPVTSGPLAAGAVTQLSASVSWSNPANALADDGQSATAATLLPGARTDTLEVKGFGFNIPPWALITAAKLDIKRSASGGAVKDFDVRLSGPGSTTSNLALTPTWPTSAAVATYGGPTTNLLPAFRPSTINDPAFGLRIIASNTGSSSGTASIDSVSLTIYYTTGPAIGPASPTTVANDPTIGTLAWTNLANASVLDGVFASTPVQAGGWISQGLATTGYGVTLPSGKQPSGVYVEMTRNAGTFAALVQDVGVGLVKAGVTMPGTNPGTSWSSTTQTVSFGSATSKFGTTLTAADVANPGFGFRIAAAVATTTLTVGPANVDAFSMWVIYDAAPTNSAKSPTVASTVTLSEAWSNLANAAVEDGNSASVAGLSSTDVTNVLRSTAHGFAIPTDAWIRGVELEVRRGSLAGGHIDDSMVYLRSGGQSNQTNHAKAGLWPIALDTISYGSASDLWGASEIPVSDVNSSSFGADFVAKHAGAGNDTVYVDGVKLSVTYCAHP